ncbi:hypothetical protein AB0K16_20070 [Nonomuraea jabiensis]
MTVLVYARPSTVLVAPVSMPLRTVSYVQDEMTGPVAEPSRVAVLRSRPS